MKIIKTILESDFFVNDPPVLFDIGASGEINKKWKKIAPYCICIAFDADDREFNITEQVNSIYKKLITFNRVVTVEPVAKANFYLTQSPFCSSVLEPDLQSLEPWIFRDLFRVEEEKQLPAITLQQVLKQLNITTVDWFKTDTQGTDLRLFKSALPYLHSPILAVEFEPGIIDAYTGEDKLYSVMKEMKENNFWLSSMNVQGIQRLNTDYTSKIGFSMSKRIIRKTPAWAEVTYFKQPNLDSPRQFLLLYVFALLERQYGFALEVIAIASQKFPHVLFQDCNKAIWKIIENEKKKAPLVILKRQLNKLFTSIND
jgi:hypothetical protein